MKNNITLSRDLNLLDITLIGVGAMIGAGIFVLTGIAAGQAGPALLLAFILNGLVTTITAAAYAELGSCFPEAGGGYLWVKEALGGLAGFLAGWMSWFAHAVACSLYALGFGAYLAELMIDLGFIGGSSAWLTKLFAVIIALLFAYINYRGAKETGQAGNIITLTKIVILGVFAAFGLAALTGKPAWPTHFVPFLPNGVGGVVAAMGLTFIAFEGYEIIAQSGEEVKNPRRNIPRAIFFSIIISVTIYLLVAFVALAAIDGQGQPTWQYLGAAGETAMVVAARQLLPGGAALLIIGGLMSTMSALNATIYSSSRVSFAMGRDKVLPDVLGAIHPQRYTPYGALIASTVIIVTIVVLLPIEAVASAADIMFLLLFALVNASAITLRRKRPDLARGFFMPLMPFLPLLGIGLMLGLAVYLFTFSPQAWVSALIWISVGVAVYFLYVTRRDLTPRAPVIEAQVEFSKEFRVLLPVAKPERVEQLAPLAAALATANNGEVLAMHVTVVPRQLPLHTGRHFIQSSWPTVNRAQEIVSAAGVPVHSMIRIGHEAVSGIIEATRETKAQAIIMGWRPRPNTADRFLGRTLESVLTDPPCDVLVLRAGDFNRPRRILVPLAGGPNAIAAAHYALQLAEHYDGQVTAITVVNEHAAVTERQEADLMLRKVLNRLAANPRLKIEVVTAPGVVEGILQAAVDHDLLMIGASREGVVDRVLFGDVPERVVALSPAPVIVVKRPVSPVTGWLRRVLDRLSAWLPHLNAERRVNVYKTIRRAARPDVDYFVMIGLSAGIASLGLLLNSPAVIIGAMLVAPLMAAIVGLGMGIVMGDMRMLKLAASAALRGMLLAVGVGVLAGWLSIDAAPTAEILNRTRPTLLDLGVALISGAAGAYALCREDVSASLPGVAIAVALVPPLATVGIGLSSGQIAVAGGALLLFLTNLIAISAASAIVFLLFGFRPAAEIKRINILRRGVIGTIILLVLMATILGAVTFNLVNEIRLDHDVRAAVTAEASYLIQTEVVEVNIAPAAGDILHLEVTVRSPRSITHQQTVTLQENIAKRLNRTVALVLTVIPTTQLDPFVPPTPTSTPTSTLTPTPTSTLTPTPGPTPIPTSTPTPTATFTPTPTPTSTPTSTPTATSSPTATATPTFTPIPTPTPVIVGQITHTQGRGVRVHISPGGPVFTAWSEGAHVILADAAPQSVNGLNWLHVRNELGLEGWIVAEYLQIIVKEVK